jgi:transcriptional regulator with XRE-family HTH domain
MAETVSCLDETNDHEKNGPVFIEGVELSEYLSWEAGQAEPSRAHLAHAADLCGVSVEMLVDGSDPEYVDFGRRYREAREAAGLSVAEVADGVGVHLGSPWKMIYREISVFGR